MLIFRNNPDIFRIMGEWVVVFLGMLLMASLKVRKTIPILAMSVYSLIFLYQSYFAISYKIYFEHPNLRNDWELMKEVLPIFLGEIGIGNTFNYFLLTCAILAFLILLYLIFNRLYKSIFNLGIIQKWAISVLIIFPFCLITGVTRLMEGPKLAPYTWRTAQWTAPMLQRSLNPIDSLIIPDETIRNYQNYQKISLSEKPDVYLLFFESYGAVIQVLEKEGPEYEDLMTQKNKQLNSNGWSATTAYSRAPIMGGRSWLSFTSVITGIHINNHITYNSLLTTHYAYPHLVRFFKENGYHTYRLKTMANQAQSTALSYSLADRFYAFDYWYKYGDIPYQGYQYDFFGGMPDQYALNYFADKLWNPNHNPMFFFMINMSSHGPWHHPPPLVKDWQQLDQIRNDPNGTDRKLEYADESTRYFNSLKYSIDVFIDFVLNKISDQSIVILLGDHQPPGMTYICYGIIEEPAVPVHIISKDSSLISSFSEYGFMSGMVPDLNVPVRVKHEGLYSMIVRELARHYGTDPVMLPDYLPDGL